MTDCPICSEKFSLPVHLPCNHKMCYLCLKTYMLNNSNATCPLCRGLIPQNLLEEATSSVVEDLHDLDINANSSEDYYTSESSEADDTIIKEKLVKEMKTYQWFYQGRNGGKWAYEKKTNRKVNKLYDIYQSDPQNYDPYQHTMRIVGIAYAIDFAHMQQINTNNDAQRHISKDLNDNVEVKGVSGIRR